MSAFKFSSFLNLFHYHKSNEVRPFISKYIRIFEKVLHDGLESDLKSFPILYKFANHRHYFLLKFVFPSITKYHGNPPLVKKLFFDLEAKHLNYKLLPYNSLLSKISLKKSVKTLHLSNNASIIYKLADSEASIYYNTYLWLEFDKNFNLIGLKVDCECSYFHFGGCRYNLGKNLTIFTTSIPPSSRNLIDTSCKHIYLLSNILRYNYNKLVKKLRDRVLYS